MTARLREVQRLLLLSQHDRDPNPERAHITGQQHALRCAGLGRQRGRHPDMAFLGLVHDLARPLNNVHHGEVIAEIVRDRVDEDIYQVLVTHGLFQADVMHASDAQRQYASARWYRVGVQLCAFELASFAQRYTGPELTEPEAHALLADYLS